MKQINHEELEQAAYQYAKKNKSFLVFGRTGIGKSLSLKKVSQKLAEERKKKFIEWDAISLEEKNDILKSPDKYYVYVDIRLTQLEPSDLRGLPNLNEFKYVEWKPNLWTQALSVCEGTLLLDEINLSPPSLQATCYQILLERQVGEIPLHSGSCVFGAGNLTEDRAGVYELPKPVRSRAGVYELKIPSVKKWTDYAIDHDVDSRVITFLTKMQSNLFMENEKTDDVVTPRGWEFVSDLIKGLDNLDDIQLYTSGIVGEGVSLEFVSFVKLRDKIPSPEELLSRKKKVPKEMDLRYACISSLAEYFRQQEKKKRVDTAKKLIDLNDDFGDDVENFVLALRLFKGIQKDIFKQMIGSKDFNKIMKYKKFLL